MSKNNLQRIINLLLHFHRNGVDPLVMVDDIILNAMNQLVTDECIFIVQISPIDIKDSECLPLVLNWINVKQNSIIDVSHSSRQRALSNK